MSFQSSLYRGGVSLFVVIDNQPYNVDNQHPCWSMLVDAFREQDSDKFLELYNEDTVTVSDTLIGDIRVKGGKVFIGKREINNRLSRYLLECIQDKVDIEPIKNAIMNARLNPSATSANEWFEFADNNNLTLTADGCFLAYKTVRDDYFSKTAGDLELIQGVTSDDGRVRYLPGDVIECNRQDVDDTRTNHCSKGIHCGGLEYAGPGGWFNNTGDRVVIVKVNPAHVVSVPDDHNCGKLRVHKLEVIGEYKTNLVESGVDNEYTEYEPQDFDDDGLYIDNVLVEIGEFYTCYYQGRKDDSPRKRYFKVVDITNDGFMCELQYPEEEIYEQRYFKADRVSELEVI